MALALALLAGPQAAHAATRLYPNLKTLPPRQLRLESADVSPDSSGEVHRVLRFTNTVWNAGPGTLILHGNIDPSTQQGTAYQRVSDTSGGSTDYPVGRFYYHPVHHHYHFDNWGRYELWTKDAYDAWVHGGRTGPVTTKIGTKTTSCVLDEEFVSQLSNTSAFGQFPFAGCSPNGDGALLEGLSPGWGDTYDYSRFEQWIDLGTSSLPDGDYVLRSVTDPENKLYESPGRGDGTRESASDNDAATPFSVRGGDLVDTSPPTGTVQINDVDHQTASPRVTLRVLGRDDVSGVDRFRVSNDGSAWKEHTYDANPDGSDRQSLSWDLSDPRYGGRPGGGSKTVYVQFHDRAAHWGPSATDAIGLGACGSSTGSASRYASAVAADRPVGFWRLDETCSATAADATDRNWGRYVGSPRLGRPGLLSEPGDTAVGFDGAGQWMQVGDSASLALTEPLSLEAWIRPDRLPSSGFASILSKPESYSLQLAGSQLEFTIIQSGLRRRLRAPAGAITPGRTYHVVGTYDGARQRLYVNGREIASRALNGAASVTSSPLFIAAWDSSRELFTGTVDEAAVYAQALSAAAVQAHQRAGTPTASVIAPSNLRARPVRADRIALTWADDASGETSLVLERARGPRFRHPTITRVGAFRTSYVTGRLRRGRTYWYRLKAVRGGLSSAWSHPARARARR